MTAVLQFVWDQIEIVFKFEWQCDIISEIGPWLEGFDSWLHDTRVTFGCIYGHENQISSKWNSKKLFFHTGNLILIITCQLSCYLLIKKGIPFLLDQSKFIHCIFVTFFFLCGWPSFLNRFTLRGLDDCCLSWGGYFSLKENTCFLELF